MLTLYPLHVCFGFTKTLPHNVAIDEFSWDMLWSVSPLRYQELAIHSFLVQHHHALCHTEATLPYHHLPYLVDWLCHVKHEHNFLCTPHSLTLLERLPYRLATLADPSPRPIKCTTWLDCGHSRCRLQWNGTHSQMAMAFEGRSGTLGRTYLAESSLSLICRDSSATQESTLCPSVCWMHWSLHEPRETCPRIATAPPRWCIVWLAWFLAIGSSRWSHST